MNILKFLESLGSENLTTGGTSRRESFSQFGQIGKGLAIASLPFGLASVSSRSYAQDIAPTPSTPIGALQLALTLEYLEDEFYQTALDTVGLIPQGGRDQKVFEQIAMHESDHVAFLIAGLGGANFVPKPTFDFTAGGAFADVFSNYQTFLAVAQAFEDTGVRAYKGQAGNLISTPDLLTAALQIHSVEARHASEVRRLRGLKGWITSNNTEIPGTAGNYAGEEVTVQAGYDTTTLFGANAGTEAYDEPLSTAQVVAIANLFIL